jgi:hypothetical protein
MGACPPSILGFGPIRPVLGCEHLVSERGGVWEEVLAATNPYRQHPTQSGGVTFGAPDILDQVPARPTPP